MAFNSARLHEVGVADGPPAAEARLASAQQADRPAPPDSFRAHPGQGVAILLCSALLHASLFMAFAHVPPPLPSIGISAISVEIVLGDGAAGGVEATAADEGQSAADAVHEAELMQPWTDTKELQPAAELRQEPTEEADKRIKQQEAHRNPETSPETPSAEEADKVSLVRQSDLMAPEPKPTPDVTALASQETALEPIVAIEANPPPPVQDPNEGEPSAERERPQQQNTAQTPPDETGRRPTREKVQPAASSARPPGGVGRGRSSTDSNYRGRVAAHLARHKQFPNDARIRGEQGSAGVTFSIDASGRVTTVKLIHSTGFATLDREAQSMVRRASPFPPPPGGQALSFSVPVSFNRR